MKKINLNDTLYPDKLKNIPSPPNTLYLEGNTKLLDATSIAIIGSRNASENGKLLAEKFATELSTSGITIVSGLALGIDSVAHTFSYNNIGKTIAVLGSGFNHIFPKENIELYNKILQNDGLIISEYPPDTEKLSSNFLKRNRIISGLSLGILIIEAQYRSGTSITSQLAREQGRKIFTVPHELWDTNGIGTNKLLKKDGILITDSEEILTNLKLDKFCFNYLNLQEKGIFDKYTRFSLKKSITKKMEKKFRRTKKVKRRSSNKSFSKKDTSNKAQSSVTQSPKKISFDNPKYTKIYETIQSLSFNESNSSKTSPVPTSINDITHNVKLPINEISSILFMLEVDGYIKKVSGGYICI